jgi:hypothetical protein
MKAARPFAVTLILLVSLSGPAPVSVTGKALGIAGLPVQADAPAATPHHASPWLADYPATTDIEGGRIYAQRSAQVDDVRLALERFAAAGLELPLVEFWIHHDLIGCDTGDGAPPVGFTTDRGGRHIIYSCGTHFTLLHELGHVYANGHLTDEARDAFVTMRDADAWRADTWARSASEHVADIIAWGLHPHHVRPSRTLPNDDASLEAAFVFATGVAPLS